MTDELRRSLELEGASLEAEVAQAETLIQKESVLHSLNELLAKLPAKYREVLALRFFEQKQFSEIAKILGKSEGTVKSLLYRGLEKLRKLTEQNATI